MTRSKTASADAAAEAEAQEGEVTSGDLSLLATMLRMRAFEQRIYDAFSENKLRGPTHLGIGQEAIAAGFAAALEPKDSVLSTYRGHDHVIAVGAPLDEVAGEILGRATGLCGGKGGSMHLASAHHGHYGCYAIVGAHLPIACGVAWSAKLRGTDEVTVCFFGDGTTNIGAFHEALNIAAVWKLPILFVCENNLYMEYTRTSEVTAVERPAADRAASYGLEALVVDGNDVTAVLEVARDAVAAARSGNGPLLIEAITYRQGGHSRADPGDYRKEDEVAEWLTKDPITAYRNALEDRGADPGELDDIQAKAGAEVEAAFESAFGAPVPDVLQAHTDVWADGGSAWRN